MHRLHFLPEVVGGWGNNCHQPGRCREIFQFFPNIVFFVIQKYFLSWQVSRNISVFSIYIFLLSKNILLSWQVSRNISVFFFFQIQFFCYPKVFFILVGVKKYFSFFPNIVFCYAKIFFYPGRCREIFHFFQIQFFCYPKVFFLSWQVARNISIFFSIIVVLLSNI